MPTVAHGPSAGHTPYTASWTATLTRSGQIHTWRANSSPPGRRGGGVVPTNLRPAWNERIPVWERRIPHWETTLGTQYRAPLSSRASFTPYSSEVSSATKSVRAPPLSHPARVRSSLSRIASPSLSPIAPTPDGFALRSQQIVTRDWSLLFSPGLPALRKNAGSMPWQIRLE